MAAKRKASQMRLQFSRRGGFREGAGRPPLRNGRVSHRKRPDFRGLRPVHATVRVHCDVASLRKGERFGIVAKALAAAGKGDQFRVVHFSVMGNHVHLIVEAAGQESLAGGMQGLLVRIAKRLNRLLSRRGPVFADHYHSRVLGSPSEVANAVAYVLGNYSHHFGGAGLPEDFRDPCSSAVRSDAVAQPKTWLLRIGWLCARRPG